jgi:hypothetical protein
VASLVGGDNAVREMIHDFRPPMVPAHIEWMQQGAALTARARLT